MIGRSEANSHRSRPNTFSSPPNVVSVDKGTPGPVRVGLIACDLASCDHVNDDIAGLALEFVGTQRDDLPPPCDEAQRRRGFRREQVGRVDVARVILRQERRILWCARHAMPSFYGLKRHRPARNSQGGETDPLNCRTQRERRRRIRPAKAITGRPARPGTTDAGSPGIAGSLSEAPLLNPRKRTSRLSLSLGERKSAAETLAVPVPSNTQTPVSPVKTPLLGLPPPSHWFEVDAP